MANSSNTTSNSSTTTKAKNNSNVTKRKSNAESCKLDKTHNMCQTKESAGHPGTILGLVDKTCAKRANQAEYDFYLYARKHKLPILKHMPKMYGICSHGDGMYMRVENIKVGMKQPVELDVKLGKFSSDYGDMRDQGVSFLRALYKSTVRTLANVGQGRISRNFAPAKFSFSTLSPRSAFRKFVEGNGGNDKTREEIVLKLNAIVDDLRKIKINIRMIGVSLLIAYDAANPSKVQVKMIDFAHTMPVNEASHSLQYVISGIENIIPYAKPPSMMLKPMHKNT